MTAALGFAGDSWFTARVARAGDKCITGFGSDHRVVSSVISCIGAVTPLTIVNDTSLELKRGTLCSSAEIRD